MGIQGTHIGDVTGASVLVIEQACENSQLLISLCRNGSQWLSPVGWTEKQKITLLDCRSEGGKTEIEIPAEFSKTLVSGDKLTLTCSELDLTQEIIWEETNLLTRSIAQSKSAPSGLAAGLTGGFLSRFKAPKTPDITETKSEAELRAEEADRAAETYRAKMEAATQAKEEAQAKALAAAKEAEAALKMEAERITEMERAAKAFEEAERLKQDGLRRVEEERRQEEARKAEEARRIEDAIKREEAARVDAERKAALERYEAALDVTQNEEARLQNRLSRLKTDASGLQTQKSEQVKTLTALKDELQLVENKAETARKAFETTTSKLESQNHDLTEFQAKSDNLTVETEQVRSRLSQADSEYLAAQKEAEMAIARADEKRNLLETIRAEKDSLIESLNTVTQKLETQANLVSDTSIKSQKLQSKYEMAEAALANKSMDIEALQGGAERITESVQTSRLEIEATQQAVEDCHLRLAAHRNAIKHLEAGGHPENMPEFDAQTRFFSSEDYDLDSEKADLENLYSQDASQGLFARSRKKRKNLARSKEAEISIEPEDIQLDDQDEGVVEQVLDLEDIHDDIHNDIKAPLSSEDIVIAPDLETEGFVRRHRKSLLAIGTILSGAVILGGGYFAVQKKPQTLSVKSSYPAAPIVKAKLDSPVAEAKTPVLEPVTIDAPVIAPQIIEVKAVETVIPEIPLPHLTLTGQSLDNAPAKKVNETKLAVKTMAAKTVTPRKSVPTKVKTPKNYPELTTNVQTKLQSLGFYSGSLNGQQTTETKEAIKTFQELYSLPSNGFISGKFLTTLVKAEAQHKQAQRNVAAVTYAPEVDAVSPAAPIVQLADTSFSEPVFYDTVTPAPTETVVTDALPEVQSYSAPIVPYQEATATRITEPMLSSVVTPATSAVISAPAIEAPSALVPPVQDVIVEAKRTRSASATYPRAAAAKNYFVNARIVVAYDIDATGSVTNPRIMSNNHTGRYNSAFEKSAIRAVQKQKFTPKTVNGQAVTSTGQTQRIVFKAG